MIRPTASRLRSSPSAWSRLAVFVSSERPVALVRAFKGFDYGPGVKISIFISTQPHRVCPGRLERISGQAVVRLARRGQAAADLHDSRFAQPENLSR